MNPWDVLGAPPPERKRTFLLPEQERQFQNWYKFWAEQGHLSPSPDDPGHKYDWRGAFAAGVQPARDPQDGFWHWPSTFKDWDHPNRFVKEGDKVYDTITGTPLE